ncbi:hypothetical protein CIB48_g6606 [Xylaria polymorpha]|nr:hypothetical protein CIB48_g6606 [Xylaria polymorpha]
MAAQLEDLKATTEAPPPPYEALDSNGKSHHSVPRYGRQQERGPAMSGKWYREDPQHPTIKFIYCLDPSRHWNSQEWSAFLLVKCSDVPCLMRDGFYWDSRNVIHEDGYITARANWTSFDALFQREGEDWGGRRHYFLKDLQQPQRWIATLEVYGLHIETLYRFDLSQLSTPKN